MWLAGAPRAASSQTLRTSLDRVRRPGRAWGSAKTPLPSLHVEAEAWARQRHVKMLAARA